MIKNLKNKKLWIILIVALIIAGAVELIINIPMINAKNQDVNDYSEIVETISSEGTTINLEGDGSYVNYLAYDYENQPEGVMVDAEIHVKVKNIYGNFTEEVIIDNNPYVLKSSFVHIGGEVSEICITFSGNLEGMKVENIRIDNEPGVNWLRVLLVFASLSILSLIYFYRSTFIKHPERLFIIICLSVGIITTIVLPLNKIGYDEEAHFRNAFLFPIPNQIESTEAINKLTDVTYENWPLNITESIKDDELMEEYYAQNCDYNNSDNTVLVDTQIKSYSMPSYLFMALGIRIGMLFNLPFLIVFTLGRLFNLIAYAIVVYFAIKKIPFGKHICAVICLMPTCIFQASVYSYDPVLISFFFLGFAYLLNEIVKKNEKLTIKNGIVILFFITFACFAKPIYFPLLFMGFLLNKEKFRNAKERLIFRFANIICILGLMFCMILPMLLTSSIIEDNRYGNVDAMAQLMLIFNNPGAFTITLFKNIFDTFIPYVFGSNSLAVLGHLNISSFAYFIPLLLIYVILSDDFEIENYRLLRKERITILIAVVLCILAVWGSMYLAFNEVGAVNIGGVQGRYYIPLLLPLYLVLKPTRTSNTFNNSNYFVTYYTTALILLGTIWLDIFNCCFL